MNDAVYHRLANVLDTLPNGFPTTDSGLEIKLLKKIFRPEDAALFCDLRLNFETAQQIAARTGRPLEGLEEHLTEMWGRGQIFGADVSGVKLFKMVAWVFGIFDFQLHNMDREMAEMCEAYMKVFSKQFFTQKPQLIQVLPVEKELPGKHQALPYEQVSNIIDNSQSFMVFDCICRKEARLLDKGCDKPQETCTAYAPIPGVFDNSTYGRVITKDEAYAVLDKAEEAGLIHMTWNMESGQFFICNCCGCCCVTLKAINELGINASDAINANYYAVIDVDECTSCGICMDERCQVNAIIEEENAYRVVREKCIGCGLCATACPVEAIKLVSKQSQEIAAPPKNEMEWFEQRGRTRGVNFSAYK